MESNYFEVFSKGLCLFCLRDTSSENEQSDRLNIITSFKMLMRYLKINLLDLCNVKCSFSYSDFGESPEDVPVVVTLCSECAHVLSTFHKMYETFELIRIKLDVCVQTLYEMMKLGQTLRKRVEEYERRMSSRHPLGLFHANVMENLRRETIYKCFLKVEARIPRVNLETEEDTFQVPKILSTSSLAPEIPPLTPQVPEDKPQHVASPSPSLPALPIDTTDDPISTSTESLNPAKVIVSPINAEVSDTIGTPYDNTPSSSSQGYLTAANMQVTDSNGLMIYNCLYCPKTFSKESSLNGHLWIHRPKFSSTYKPSMSIGKGGKGGKLIRSYGCTLCQKSFKTRAQLKFHIKKSHQENPGRIKCLYCQETFSSKCTKRSHTQNFHTVQLMRQCVPEGMTPQRMQSIVDSECKKYVRFPNTSNPIGCHLCCEKFTRIGRFKCHFINEHFHTSQQEGISEELQENIATSTDDIEPSLIVSEEVSDAALAQLMEAGGGGQQFFIDSLSDYE